MFLFTGFASANINIDDDSNCEENGSTEIEENQMVCGEDLIIWWSGGTNPPSGTYCAVLSGKGIGTTSATFTFNGSCNVSGGNGVSGTFYWQDTGLNAPNTFGSYKVQVCEGACPCSK